MSDFALRALEVSVRLGGQTIFRDLNVEIGAGEFVGVFGPNGAGKSTFIRAVLGLVPLTSGKIELLGGTTQSARRNVGYMPQSISVPQGIALSARELVKATVSGSKPGLPICNPEQRKMVDLALHLAGAEGYANKPFGVLSGGEKQRVALAQAILHSPRMLILDEPLASLDPKNQAALVDCVARIQNETAITVLFVAHDLNPLLKVMDRALYLAGGNGVIGQVDDVVTSEKLTSLYKTPIEVLRANGRIFILHAGENTLETARHG
jgi:zinc/manganese transport system ATP-binding protein